MHVITICVIGSSSIAFARAAELLSVIYIIRILCLIHVEIHFELKS